MINLPMEIINYILLFNQHKTSEMMKPLLDKYNIKRLETLNHYYKYYKINYFDFTFLQYLQFDIIDYCELLLFVKKFKIGLKK